MTHPELARDVFYDLGYRPGTVRFEAAVQGLTNNLVGPPLVLLEPGERARSETPAAGSEAQNSPRAERGLLFSFIAMWAAGALFGFCAHGLLREV